MDIGFAPLHDLAQLVPVVHLFKSHLLHRRPGDDHAVKFSVLQLIKGLIKGQQMFLGNIFRHMTLIAMRLNEKSPLSRQKYMLKMSHSSGMKENDAIKIDEVLKGMKCSGNTTVSSEAKNEAHRYLEYEIEF